MIDIGKDLQNAYSDGFTDGYILGQKDAWSQWIPCSERLPNKTVLCCDNRGEMIIGIPYKDEESNTEFSAESYRVLRADRRSGGEYNRVPRRSARSKQGILRQCAERDGGRDERSQ